MQELICSCLKGGKKRSFFLWSVYVSLVALNHVDQSFFSLHLSICFCLYCFLSFSFSRSLSNVIHVFPMFVACGCYLSCCIFVALVFVIILRFCFVSLPFFHVSFLVGVSGWCCGVFFLFSVVSFLRVFLTNLLAKCLTFCCFEILQVNSWSTPFKITFFHICIFVYWGPFLYSFQHRISLKHW